MAKQKKGAPVKKEKEKQSLENILQAIVENQMIDDHGPAIIGLRTRKPNIQDNIYEYD